MKRRPLGANELELSEIGFGAWAVGGGGYSFGWGVQDDKESVAAIRRALDLGINWIDTAPVYGLGHSEEIVGMAVAGRRNDIYLATKCSLVWDEKGTITDSLAAHSIARECEASLKRLKTDVIDLYQIHWPNDSERIEEGWTAIGDLIASGKVRYGGLSNFHFDHSNMERANAVRQVTALQAPYSMLRRYPEAGTFDYLREHSMGFLAYSPLQVGLLSGRFDRSRIHPEDWRNRAQELNGPNLAVNLAFVEMLRPIAAKYGKTVAQLAIAWVLRIPEVTSAIVGARRPGQIEETAGGSGWTMDTNDLDEMDRLLAERWRQLKAAGGYFHPKETDPK